MSNTSADARFWDRIARKYAADPIKDMAGYERTIARTRHWLSASHTVLELGCGTGTSALLLAPSVARIVGSDLSGEMVAIATQKAAAQNCANASFVVGAAEDAVAPDGSCDAVLAFNLLHLVADRRAALERVRRLLKPGGLFISKTPCLAEMNPLIRLAVPLMQLIGKAPHVSFFKAAALEDEIAAAGFTVRERDRHGSGRRDPRIFLVGRRDEAPGLDA
ncbi:class I SAM-dependent methyltransferase [Phreatobacter sp. HK31-P]